MSDVAKEGLRWFPSLWQRSFAVNSIIRTSNSQELESDLNVVKG